MLRFYSSYLCAFISDTFRKCHVLAVYTKLVHCLRSCPCLTGVQLRWTFDNVSELLHMAVSAKADATSWIGIGFNPMFPSMYNADVVSGHATDTGGPGCVVPLYAAESIGAPQPNPLFNISNTRFVYTCPHFSSAVCMHTCDTRPIPNACICVRLDLGSNVLVLLLYYFWCKTSNCQRRKVCCLKSASLTHCVCVSWQ